ncbi:MAG: ATP-dependent DNA helicase RecG, partial [Oscillospiraceae bacterium]|nr:ATP-dependent DNA helicase RecG [Oscillospiraceae bacterium]
GRGKEKSYCILLSDSRNEETRARLKVMTQTNDGFVISQEDLRLRGPGDFFGQRQHGLPAMKIADLSCDMRLLDEAQTAARQLMAQDPERMEPTHQALRDRIRQLFDTNADMLN